MFHLRALLAIDEHIAIGDLHAARVFRLDFDRPVIGVD
jgi:hypothetical protein